MTDDEIELSIAIIGMAGRFPQAPDIDSFWAACRDGVHCITKWQGAASDGRVLAGGLLADQDLFDAESFGIPPAEADILDPQHRVFLEVCLQGLEHAAVAPRAGTLVSVYAAAAPSRYRPSSGGEGETARYQHMIAQGPDYLATRVSYHLDLRGEAVNVQTACSSSLVAVHLACLSLQSNRSDIALAGGVSIDPDQGRGYVYEPGMITSSDGACRPFDAAACGAVPGSGAGVVVLQRLSDALDERRTIHAVIRASAINNDGRAKASFMAPNVEGQSEAIATALATAGVPATSIGYLETHGTATRLGDAIEFEAARTAFRHFTDDCGFCALGSLKANFGHMDRAAGVAGLIKAAYAVRDGVIPPLVGFKKPNPDFDFPTSPFRPPTKPETWCAEGPRRAGVSSFGVGGTNAHVIVEEPPRVGSGAAVDGAVALPLSAQSEEALQHLARSLAGIAEKTNVADIANTLAKGRPLRPVRGVVVSRQESLPFALTQPLVARAPSAPAGALAIMFPGQGAETNYDATALAKRYPTFADDIEAFAAALEISSTRLLSGVDGSDPAYRAFAYQPSLVAVQIALAELAQRLGLTADAFCGNSLGEYAAAYLAGVFDREGLMTVLAARDRLMRAAPEGRMLAVLLSADEVAPMMISGIDLAGENWLDRVLLSGAPDIIDRQHAALAQQGVMSRILPGHVGPHGRLMYPIADQFRQAFSGVGLNSATRRIASTLTGDWVQPNQMADPEHWVRHLIERFKFRQAFEALKQAGFNRFVESSPGDALTKLVRGEAQPCATLGGGEEPAVPAFLQGLADAWRAGAEINWNGANGITDARLVPLAGYPFRRKRHWRHQTESTQGHSPHEGGLLQQAVWRPRPVSPSDAIQRDMTILGEGALAEAVARRLIERGARVLRSDDGRDVAAVASGLLIDLRQANLPADTPEPLNALSLTDWLKRSFLAPLESLRHLHPAKVLLATRGLWSITPGEKSSTAQAGVVGLARCAPHDWPGLQARIVDLDPSGAPNVGAEADAVVIEIAAVEEDDVAYRGGVRYARLYEATTARTLSPLRRGGAYVVLGGSGRLGAVVAEAISREVSAKIYLVGRDSERAIVAPARALINAAEARGCTVIRRTARTDEQIDLKRLLDELTAEQGRIDGVFHLAADTNTAAFSTLEDMTLEEAIAITRAKVCTAALLAQELANRDYDFVALFSSISTVIGANRFGAYVAANAYLDALAVSMSAQTRQRWRSLVWDGWAADGVLGQNALGFDDGASLLLRALRSDAAVAAAVVLPLDTRLASVRADLDLVARDRREAQTFQRDTPVAAQVFEVIRRVTGHHDIDPTRTFASMGVDSLRMMQIAARLQSLLGRSVGIGKLLAARSADEILAVARSTLEPTHSTRATVSVPPEALSTPQQRLWYLTQLDPHSSSYNVPFGWRVAAPYEIAAVRQAVLRTLDQHELLRAAYRQSADGHLSRITLATAEIPFFESELTGADVEQSYERIVREVVEAPFDLEHGSTRVLIVSTPEDARIVFVCHHVSIDAWSVKLLRDEIALRLNPRNAIAAPRAVYHDFVRWEQEIRNGADADRNAQYWRDTLRDIKPSAPPCDEGMSEKSERPVAHATALLPHDRLSALRLVLQNHGATLYAAALTGLAVALSQWCGGSEIVIGANFANRMREEFESIVGLFVDPMVLRLSPGSDDPALTIGDALTRVSTRLADCVSHSAIPYLDIVSQTERLGTGGDNPLFDVIATMFDTESGGSGALTQLDLPLPRTSKFALAVEFLPRKDGLLIHVLYAADRYREASINRMLERVLQYLTMLADGDASRPLHEVLNNKVEVRTRERFARRFARPADSQGRPE